MTRRDVNSEPSLAQAERAGRVEAEIVDLRNLLEESLSREQHWMDRALYVERSAEEAAYMEEQRSLWRAIRLEDEIEKQRVEAAAAGARALAAEQAATELESKLRRETERASSAEERATAASSQAETRTRKLAEAEDSLRRLTAKAIAKSRRLESADAELSNFRRQLAAEQAALESAHARSQAAESSLAEALRHLERYAAFHRSLEDSSGWRIIQAVRRLLGAKW